MDLVPRMAVFVAADGSFYNERRYLQRKRERKSEREIERETVRLNGRNEEGGAEVEKRLPFFGFTDDSN